MHVSGRICGRFWKPKYTLDVAPGKLLIRGAKDTLLLPWWIKDIALDLEKGPNATALV